jgi:hypothetical protein
VAKPITIVDVVPFFKAGDPPPSGYVEWHEWASVQLRAGLRQKRCESCGRYRFPQELKNGACFPVRTCGHASGSV